MGMTNINQGDPVVLVLGCNTPTPGPDHSGLVPRTTPGPLQDQDHSTPTDSGQPEGAPLSERWLEQVKAATARRERMAEMRREMAARRSKGLELRHAAKLRRQSK